MRTQFIHNPNWSKSTIGTPISLWSFRQSNTRRPILFIGGVHGDEPEGVWLAEDFILWLKDHSTEEDWRHFSSFAIIPCLNIDGFSKNQRTNAQGVDLNRNFPSQDWSPEAKAERYYPGPSPESEAETQALVKLINEQQPRLIIHFHSWKPCVVYTGDSGKAFAEILALSSGYPCEADIGYPTPGSLGQYGWLSKNTPVICIEVAEGEVREKIWPKFKIGLIEILKMSESR